MTRIHTLLSAFMRDENGAAMIEYAVLIGLITVAAVTLISGVGGWVETSWQDLSDALLPAAPG
jgi:pilus assembly protein Flp/PilA